MHTDPAGKLRDAPPDSVPGPLLASGRNADVYALDAGRVLRRYRARARRQTEAQIMKQVRAYGFPAPCVYEVTDRDMVMERVDGPTMFDDLTRRPWMLVRHARLLARLHRRLHAIPAPDWLPALFPSAPTQPEALPAPEPPPHLEHAADRVAAMQPHRQGAAVAPAPSPHTDHPEGGAILHFDLHLLNVLLTARGPVVIDWEAAKRGPALADVAQTWVVLATSEIPVGGWRGRYLDLLRRLFVRAFLAHFDRRAVLAVLPRVAERRLTDPNVRAGERLAIERLLEQHAGRH
ncbi:MAG: phosphotransferase [Chloroflexi bacterium]|nr:phosphotransferase [Chloroflexota bacterium]